jgi:hypothetical protein
MLRSEYRPNPVYYRCRPRRGLWSLVSPLNCVASTDLSLFASRLREQRRAGRDVLVGELMTAVDLAWAAFAALVKPLPEPECPMQQRWRDLYTWTPESIPAEDVDLLLSHRDRIYEKWLTLPVPTQ